jgi:hypothetical protein
MLTQNEKYHEMKLGKLLSNGAECPLYEVMASKITESVT